MKAQFYIDRQFGHPIWINVENGIITEFPHEGKMEKVLNEKYKGALVMEFKKDFEERMKPSFHCVKPADITSKMVEIHNLKMRISLAKSRMGQNSCRDTEYHSLDKMVDDVLIPKINDVSIEIEAIKKTLKEVHKFIL